MLQRKEKGIEHRMEIFSTYIENVLKGENESDALEYRNEDMRVQARMLNREAVEFTKLVKTRTRADQGFQKRNRDAFS